MIWQILDPRCRPENLGLIPTFFSEEDPRPAKVQADANYAHGGGWTPMMRWTRRGDNWIKYPGDQPLKPLAMTQLRDETIFFYDCAWVMILQKDGSFEVSRMD